MRPPVKYDNSDIPEDIPEEIESNLEDAAKLTSSNAKTPVGKNFIEDLKVLARKQLVSRHAINAIRDLYDLEDFQNELSLYAESAPSCTSKTFQTLKFFWNWAHENYAPIVNEPVFRSQTAILQYEFKELKAWSQMPDIRAMLKQIAS